VTSISSFFKNTLGAPLANARWSWGAVNANTGQVFLRVWIDERETVDGMDQIHLLASDWSRRSPGYPERERQVELLRSGAEGYGVLCVAGNPHTRGARKIREFDDQKLLKLGQLIDREGGSVYAMIVATVLVETVSHRSGNERQPGERYWWVNHKQTFRQEVDGEYLWSPKKNQNGANNESYNNMTKVMPGDIVFSFADAAIRAVGVVLDRAREAPKPLEFASAGDQWGTDLGWQVSVRFEELTDPLRPKEHASQLAAVLPEKHSPIRASGDGNQGVYLAAVPEAMAKKLEELLAGQAERVVQSITETTGGALKDDAAEARLQQRTDIGPTVKKTLVNARRGQGVFRDNLEQIERKCRVTGVLDRRHLRASHIKPWCICDDREKLDGYNGLLLSPHVDHLFDRGHISFSDNGDLLLSKDLNRAVLESWGIALPRNVGSFTQEQRRYLEYHRTHVFEKSNSGRRAQSPGVAVVPESTVDGELVVLRPE
jgi:putative restriction endonuclease